MLHKTEDECLRKMLEWRGILPENICRECNGSGKKMYGSTLTWRAGNGGFGGQMMTIDVCDHCWGSGDCMNPWTNLRKIQSISC